MQTPRPLPRLRVPDDLDRQRLNFGERGAFLVNRHAVLLDAALEGLVAERQLAVAHGQGEVDALLFERDLALVEVAPEDEELFLEEAQFLGAFAEAVDTCVSMRSDACVMCLRLTYFTGSMSRRFCARGVSTRRGKRTGVVPWAASASSTKRKKCHSKFLSCELLSVVLSLDWKYSLGLVKFLRLSG